MYDFRFFFNEGYMLTSTFLYDMAFGFLPRRFAVGELIYKEDDDVEELYLICKGTVYI